MTQKLLINFSKSLKYHNYDNAKFIGSILLNLDTKYHLLLPISLYLDGEYSRSIFFLTEIDTYTSNFYLALNYMKIKEFKKAVVCIRKIINEKCKEDTSIHFSCDYLLVNKQDKNYFNDILGDLYVQLMEKDESIKAFTACYIEDPLFNSIENLLNENLIPIFDENKKEGPIAEYITDVMKYYNDLSESVISKYLNKIPGIGSYVLANIAKKLFDLSLLSDSRKCFYLLISKDPKLLYNMDYFSTVLWHGSDITDLGILCKNLITNAPNEAITWKALGNFYNHKNDYQRSMLCFKRSLYIKNEHYTNTLLGYESIQKNEYETALGFFRRSCFMLRDNYKAIFGCGLVYDKMEKKELAEGHFNSALQKNPKNKHIKVLSMKFYIKQGDMDTAIKIFADGMNFETTDIDKMTELVLKRGGGFTDIEEFLVLEFAEILMKLNLMEHSTKMLKMVECRGETYYRKRDLIYERNASV